jgi:AcrR family transcriptional regulator
MRETGHQPMEVPEKLPRQAVPRSAARIASTARPGENPDGQSAERKLTRRGRETRRRLVVAARKVFEESGFVEARVEDIAKEADMANGSFYTYFESKVAVLDAVAMDVFAELEAATHTSELLGARETIEAVNKQYFDTWLRNSKMLVTLHQVSGFLPEFFARLTKSHELHAQRSAARIRQMQAEGLVDGDLDPHHAAVALGSMVEQSLRWWIGQQEPFDPDLALQTLNKLWIRAIGLDRKGPVKEGQ